ETRIRYLDDHSKKKRGDEETFNLGGQDESDSDSVVRTYSCNSPLGRAIVGKEVGEIVEVLTPDKETYEIEILAYAIPAEDEEAQAA
ncbi:MAG TPA: GreA/GreB family elongation factor, partial [Candidatus Paceibacterota bacterium]|nr:GreA/GreB family elongation factor [Candidatus Paceibacterota bacterium]